MTSLDRSPWQSILESAIAEQAFQSIDDIADALRCVIDDPAHATTTGSLEGYAGMALFFAFKARSNAAASRDASDARACLERAIHQASELPPTLYRGFVGVAWTVASLPELAGALGVEVLEHVDELLHELIDWQASTDATWAYDLFNGLVGIGVYALARGGPSGDRLLCGVVELLRRCSHAIRGGLAWARTASQLPNALSARFPEGRVDVGVAHGCAGVLGLVTAVNRAASAHEPARALARGAIQFLLALVRDHPGADWPPVVGVVDARPLLAPPGTPGPTSWCNGGFGIVSVLCTATARHGTEAERVMARTMARRMTEVEPPPKIEAGLCHGALGIAHIFARFYHQTTDCIFRDAAIRWTRVAFATQTPGTGIAGWQALGHDGVLRAQPGLLIGASGMGLALLALATDVSPGWDRLLLLST